MSRETTIEYKGFIFNDKLTDEENPESDKYNRYEYQFDFDNFNSENFIGKEEDFQIQKKRFSRVFSNKDVENNFRVPASIFETTPNAKIRLNVGTESNQRAFYREILTMLNGGSTGFYMITMQVYSTNLVTNFDNNGIQTFYGVEFNLIREEKFYSLSRPFSKFHPNHTHSQYYNYEFEIEPAEQLVGEEHTVTLSNLIKTQKDGYLTDFLWRKFNSIDDVEDINDFRNIVERNIGDTLWVRRLRRHDILNSGTLSNAISLKNNKTLELKNTRRKEIFPSSSERFQNPDFPNYESLINSADSVPFRWDIQVPLLGLYFLELRNIQNQLFIQVSSEPSIRRNLWGSLPGLDIACELNCNTFKITNPEYFESDFTANTGVDYGPPTHIGIHFGFKHLPEYFSYKIGTDFSQEFSRLENDEILILKRPFSKDSSTFSNGNLVGTDYGETYIPSTPAFTETKEISGQFITTIQREDNDEPHLLKLDDFTFLYNDKVYIPYWQLLLTAFRTTGNHPLGIQNYTTAINNISPSDMTNDYYDFLGRKLGSYISNPSFSKEFITGSDDTWNTWFHTYSGPSEAFLTRSGFEVLGSINIIQRHIAPKPLTPYYTSHRISSGFMQNWRNKKQWPIASNVQLPPAYFELIQAAKSDLAIAWDNFNMGNGDEPGLSPDYFINLEIEINEIMSKLSEPYEIMTEPHNFENVVYLGRDLLVVIVRNSNTEIIPPNDYTNRTNMYCDPGKYSKFDLHDLERINFVTFNEIIEPMVDNDLWDYEFLTDPGGPLPDLIEIDSRVSSFFREWEIPEEDYDWYPFWIGPELPLDDPNPTNLQGRVTDNVYNPKSGTDYEVNRNPYFSYELIENDFQEHYEVYFKADIMRNVDGFRNCSRKTIQQDADLLFKEPEEETSEEQEERLKAKEKWKLEEAKRRAVIQKQMQDF